MTVPESLTKAELIDRLRLAEGKAEACETEAAVYRQQLAQCETLARQAMVTPDVNLAQKVMSQASLGLNERNVKQWAKDWRRVWLADMEWLRSALAALKDIKRFNSRLDVQGPNETLKRKIETRLKQALVQRAPSSVSVSSLESDMNKSGAD